jgi:hypothetical protein
MYAEHNDSADPSKDWEFSVEFYPDEQAEYNFYIASSEGQEQVRPQSPRKRQQAQGRRKARAGQKLHKRMPRRTCY